jgi:hypothetical protein
MVFNKDRSRDDLKMITNNPTLESPIYGEESFYTDDFLTEKEEKRFIREVEKIVRKSPEYDRWVRFVHGALGTGFVCYLTGHTSDECKIELHHYPISLYNYIQIAIYNSDSFTSFDIAYQVMKWHFENMIGFIPLSQSVHEMYHNNYLKIPINIVEGEWEAILTAVDIPDKIKAQVDMLKTITLDSVSENWEIREKQYDLKNN